jgi:hypothetical protein
MHTLEHPRFTVEHHGHLVTGRQLLRNRRQLVVQLVHPFGLLHSSLMMPDFMAQSGLSLEGSLGDEKRALLLRDLHDQASLVTALLPTLLPTVRPTADPDDERNAFVQHMDRAVADALHQHPTTAALPPLHPARFHRTVRWLRAYGTLPDVRIAPPTFDRELEWQFLLLLHLGATGHYHRLTELGNWEGN